MRIAGALRGQMGPPHAQCVLRAARAAHQRNDHGFARAALVGQMRQNPGSILHVNAIRAVQHGNVYAPRIRTVPMHAP